MGEGVPFSFQDLVTKRTGSPGGKVGSSEF